MKEFISNHNLYGLLMGACTFIVIGLFHPLVIKGEYYFSKKCWWGFLLLGILALGASVLIKQQFISILMGVVAFSSFWGIGEVIEQEDRVKKGWFPKNPKRKYPF